MILSEDPLQHGDRLAQEPLGLVVAAHTREQRRVSGLVDRCGDVIRPKRPLPDLHRPPGARLAALEVAARVRKAAQVVVQVGERRRVGGRSPAP